MGLKILSFFRKLIHFREEKTRNHVTIEEAKQKVFSKIKME